MTNLCSNYVLCSTLYVIHDEKFLLVKHPKLNKWVPPGGKIEPNEMPQDAALRECFEETGLKVELVGTPSPLKNGLMTPYGLEYNAATTHCGSHLDFIYFGKIDHESLLDRVKSQEEIEWFSLEEILHLNTFESIAKWCAFFLEKINSIDTYQIYT